MSEVMVSIIVPTYGHENYIKLCLESVLNQKVNFKYEVIIGEDRSPDNTKLILKYYEAKYPNVIRVYYRDENMYSNLSKYPYGNSGDLKLKANGKYLIQLEGDDYWTSAMKLQTQVDFLEKNSEYIAVAHNTIVIDESGNPTDFNYPESKNKEYTINDYCSDILPGQTATLLYRNVFLNRKKDLSFLLDANLGPGDRRTVLYLLSKGKIYCIQSQMSAYRYNTRSGLSYSATYKPNLSRDERLHASFLTYSYNYVKDKNFIMCTEMIYYRWLFRVYRKKLISKNDYFQYLSKIKNINRAKFLFIIQVIKQNFFKILFFNQHKKRI